MFGRITEDQDSAEVYITVSPKFLPDDIVSWLCSPDICENCAEAAKAYSLHFNIVLYLIAYPCLQQDSFIASRTTFTNATVQVQHMVVIKIKLFISARRLLNCVVENFHRLEQKKNATFVKKDVGGTSAVMSLFAPMTLLGF